MSVERDAVPEGYPVLLAQLKEAIGRARHRAALSINRELVLLYWRIGRDILDRQTAAGWGAKVIDRLAADLGAAFPGMKGLSARNLKYMRAFAEAWPDPEIVQQRVAQLPWGHNIRLIQSVKDPDQRLWYADQSIENGWSRRVLAHQIESELFARQGAALTNFSRTLPTPQSDLAQELVKDPYSFDFLPFGPDLLERDLERGLIEQMRELILELGKGFAFVGSQHHLEVGGQDFYLDLLFYHLRLRAFIVIELKVEDFRPEFAGKMNFYLSAVDDQLRHPDDGPSIGIILCQGRNEIIVEYALRDTQKPMGVARYTVSPSLPKELERDLPTFEDLTAELPSFALVRARVELEHRLRERLEMSTDARERPRGLGELLAELETRGLAPAGTAELRESVLPAMNRVAHALEIDAGAIERALASVRQYLDRLGDP